jgi:hypothetical protein
LLTSTLVLDRLPKYKGLSPEAKAVVEERLRTGVAGNKPEEFMGLAKFVTDFVATGDETLDNLAVADLKAKVSMRFAGAYKDQLNKMIDGMLGDPASLPDFGDRMLTDAFASGHLGNYKVPYVKSRAEGFFGFMKPVEGTALSPEDLAQTDSEVPESQRLLPGEIAQDQKLKALAAERLYKGMRMVEAMRNQKRKPQEIEDWVNTYVQSIGLYPAGGPNPILFNGITPDPDPEKALETVRKRIEELDTKKP